jgi:DNA mismatch repair protein MutL
VGQVVSAETDPQSSFAVKTKVEQKKLDIEAEVKDAPQFLILGVLHDRYILLQGDDGLVVMDPKAARERLVYESLLDDGSGGVESQGLLVPELVDLDPKDFDVVMTNLENFTEAGISLEPFGGGTIQVRSMPAVLGEKDPRAFITALIDELVDTVGGKRGKSMAFEVFAEKLAKRAAWNEVAKRNGVEPFLEALFSCDLPYCAPDGRPTLIHLSLKELERKFS